MVRKQKQKQNAAKLYTEREKNFAINHLMCFCTSHQSRRYDFVTLFKYCYQFNVICISDYN